jgi:sporulation protein YlmC with PRC-barrel domain
MGKTQKTETKAIVTLRPSKWGAGAAALLLSAMLLGACGGSSEPVVESTVVPTLEAPAADTPTVEAAETPAADASDTTTDTTDVDASDTTTDTEGVEGTETTTDTEGIEGSDTTTDTEGTGGAGVGDSDTMTDTEGAESSDTMTDTEGAGSSDTMTDTEGAGSSDAMTDTEGVGDSDTMTGTGGTGDTTAGASATDAADSAALMGVSGVSPKQYVRASTLLDYDFENTNGDVSGDLEDLLIDLSTGRILFASIEYGGVLDLGDKDIVVPMNAFAIGEEGELVLNIDETALESYPDVGNDWPNLDDPAWDDDVNTYWNDTGVDVGEGIAEATGTVGWASEIIGRNIADAGFGAGSILDILVNLGTGRAPYLIVDQGTGLDTDPYIIPLAAFNVSDWSNEFAYGPDFTPDLIESAPTLNSETYPEGTAFDEDFGDTLESTWNDLGFSNDLNNDGEVD